MNTVPAALIQPCGRRCGRTFRWTRARRRLVRAI